MNRLLRILAGLFGIVFIVTLVMSVSSIVSLFRTPLHSSGDEPGLEYHFAVFLPDTSSQFFAQVAEGAREAALAERAALSFHPIGEGEADFELARFTGVDGVIVYPHLEETAARAILEELNTEDIPVVLIEHSLSDDSPWPFVGTNNFDLGRKIGELISVPADRAGRIAVVYSDKSPAIKAEKELLEMGIVSALGGRLTAPISRKETGLNPLHGEELAYEILRGEPEITSIVFTDVNDTLAAAQVLIDLNLVGTVRIIGFGTEPPIPDYIEKGILAGSIVVNPRKVGSSAVKVLAGLARDGYSSDFVDTGVEILRGAP